MKQYTILLLYPGFMSDEEGETYLAWVEAEDINKAVHKAQVEALRSQGGQAGLKARDFKPLFATYGHQRDLVVCGDQP